jgi:hypothetical protein
LDGSAPLADVIYVLTRHDYCFISLFDSVIGGISRLDIQKPVVRMWLFGMITFFELYLNERVDKVWPEDSWKDQISSARLERLATDRSLRFPNADVFRRSVASYSEPALTFSTRFGSPCPTRSAKERSDRPVPQR